MHQQGYSSLFLGPRLIAAVSYARDLHIENRKGTDVPYLAHLFGVASLVMGECGSVSFPVTEDAVLAALLHDAAEDWGGRPRLEDIRRIFGQQVAEIVEGCTDTFEDPKPEWKARKSAYLRRLPGESDVTRLVSAADKLHNARAILEDYLVHKSELWKRFRRGRDEQLWYFEELVRVFTEAGPTRISTELGRVVAEIRRVSLGQP